MFEDLDPEKKLEVIAKIREIQGSNPFAEQPEAPMQMAENKVSDAEAKAAIDAWLAKQVPPEATPTPTPTPTPVPETGLFGGKKTREEQLQEELRRQKGQ